jgi:molybdopterin-guanine dinucleotide biosynthesis protein A
MMVYGVILAGGRSSRMGEDKATLQLDGKDLLERTSDLLRAAGADVVLVSGRPQLPDGFADLFPNCGPPGAVLSTLHWLRQHHGLDGSMLVFLPVDMPLLQVDTVTTLIAASRSVDAAQYERAVFPCVMKATDLLFAHLQHEFQLGQEPGGRRSMKAILGWLETRRLPLDAATEAQLLNANTPEDWAQVQMLWQQRNQG